MKKEPTTFFVIMKTSPATGRLQCAPVYNFVACTDFYAYTSRAWAEKRAKRVEGDVYSVQGFDCVVEGLGSWQVKVNMFHKHDAIRAEAEKMFN